MKMNNTELAINALSGEQFVEQEKSLNNIVERLDFLDVQILRKFYVTGDAFPQDTRPYCFPILFSEMKVKNNLKIGMEALRKRLDNLVDLGLLVKVKNSNPTNYFPVNGMEDRIRAMITKFFIVSGLSQYL